MASNEEETLYCICREPYDGERFMIECDKCNDWFHGSCVDIQEHQAADIETYHCPDCQIRHGPLVLKKRRTWRHDYSESGEGLSKKAQAGTVRFIAELKSRTFPSAEGILAYLTDGYELDMEFLEETEFHYPVIVLNREGLDLKVPPSSFSIQDVENHIGSMKEIDVIDVARQEDCKMLMREWTEYYTSSVRHKVLNVISLEFSKTRLSNLVEPPRMVRELSWVNNYWPRVVPEGEPEYERPSVQKYCLMSVKDSYTDFHIDFGGTSVWYHVLRGEKVFYLIEPTSANLQLYETWISSASQSNVFFGDQVHTCYRCVLKQGQTLFIPTGWIHAVLTPIDSLVFGGNFLHNFNIHTQIQVYEIERRTGASKKYMFPNYETLHWYAAQSLLKTLQGYTRLKKDPPYHLLSGVKAMTTALREWTHKRDLTNKKVYIKRDAIPDAIQYGKLLKDLEKEVRMLTKAPKGGKRKQKQEADKKDSPSKKEIKANLDDSFDQYTSQSDIEVDVKEEEEKPDVKNISSKDSLSTKVETKVPPLFQTLPTPSILTKSPRAGDKSPRWAGDKSPRAGDKSPRIGDKSPRAGDKSPRIGDKSPRTGDKSPRIGDKSPRAAEKLFKSREISPRGGDKSPRLSEERSPVGCRKSASSSSPRSSLASPPRTNPKLTFRLPKPASRQSQSSDISVYDFEEEEASMTSGRSGSEIGSPLGSPRSRRESSGGGGGDLFSPPRKLTLKLGASAATVSGRGDQGRTVSTSQDESSAESESDSEQLVVDEAPRKRRKMAVQQPQQQLKMTLAVNRREEPGVETSQDSSYTSDVDVVGDSPSKPFSPSHAAPHRPVSHIGREQEERLFSGAVPGDPHALSPARQSASSASMQDAIQGMLSMSRLPTVSSTLQPSSKQSPFKLDKEKSKATLRLQRESKARSMLSDDELGERGSTAYKDDEFIYPALAGSDNEEDSASKQERDDAWNPRGRVTASLPRKELTPRHGARKESVESQLEDAAAKLAHKPMPKRHYVKRKPKPDQPPQSSSYEPMPSSSYHFDPSSPAPLYMDYSASSSSLSRSQPDTAKTQQQAAKKSSSSSKKGSTAKQRLGKILGMHKMGLF